MSYNSGAASACPKAPFHCSDTVNFARTSPHALLSKPFQTLSPAFCRLTAAPCDRKKGFRRPGFPCGQRWLNGLPGKGGRWQGREMALLAPPRALQLPRGQSVSRSEQQMEIKTGGISEICPAAGPGHRLRPHMPRSCRDGLWNRAYR